MRSYDRSVLDALRRIDRGPVRGRRLRDLQLVIEVFELLRVKPGQIGVEFDLRRDLLFFQQLRRKNGNPGEGFLARNRILVFRYRLGYLALKRLQVFFNILRRCLAENLARYADFLLCGDITQRGQVFVELLA